MTLASAELYELFLGLAPLRLQAARSALTAEAEARELALESALIPLAVDAALLGADGLRELSHAVSAAGLDAPEAELERAIETLELSVEALGAGDESGARVNESELKGRAERLRSYLKQSAPAGDEQTPQTEAGDSVSPWQPKLDPDMIAAFLDECSERLEGLAERLLLLESRGDDRELIGELFRDLHTLKGSSAFAGLTQMNRVAHLAEDLMGELRDGKRQATRPLIDVLLETLDVLRQIVDRARAGAPIDVEISTLLERLKDPERVPFAAPKASTPGTSTLGASAPSVAAAQGLAAPRAAQATLRIDFEKIDRLLNLVGEVVLARGQLTHAAESQSALVRELGQLRQRLSRGQLGLAAPSAPSASSATSSGSLPALPSGNLTSSAPTPARLTAEGRGKDQLGDDLQRTERVLRESQGDLESSLATLGLAVSQLRDDVMKLRMVPISRLFSKYQRTVRELSHKLGKEVLVELEGAETELDKVLVERLEDPLLHLVRNAVDHGIEAPDVRARAGKPSAGRLLLRAAQRGGQVVVTISDDGAGMDPERLRQKAVEKGLLTPTEAMELSDADSFQLIFRAGFSTAQTVSDVSGRGVGMDVVRDAITKLKGSIHLESTLGRGSALELRLPLTLAITQILVARAGGELVAVPLDSVASAQHVAKRSLELVGDSPCLRVADELIPVVDLAEVLGLGELGSAALGDNTEHSVIIVELGTERFGLLVQQVLGRHEVVIKSLGPLLVGTPCAAGATLVGDRILLVVDLADVAARVREGGRSHAPAIQASTPSGSGRVLVAEDSDVIREAIRRELVAAGFEVVTACDGQEALELALRERFDAISTDVMMPRMDGYELTRRLRADPRYAALPIVMVTGKDARLDTLRGYDSGASAYITKPADARELVRALRELLTPR
ncbi:MAG: response regulator [Polyangiaceae bacterium]|nr:response regulator [Polyangiaceae bacterium]MCW5790609.1 response regulator [Polyangiaceae bacterium]